jgi:hypothetical protein
VAASRVSFALITLGMALGLGYVLSSWIRLRLRPVADLLVALRPLLVPVLVLAAAATTALHVVLQLISAITLVLLVHALIVRPELNRTSNQLGMWWHAIENGAANAVRKLAWVAIPAVMVSWGVTALFGGLLAGQGGLPAAFLLAALVALGLALVARLTAYAISWFRGAVAVLLGCATVTGLMFAGVLPGGAWLGSTAIWLAVAAAAVLVATVVNESFIPPGEPAAGRLQTTEQFLGAGLGLAMITGVLLVCATASSLWTLSWQGNNTPLAADPGARTQLYANADTTPEYVRAPVLAFTQDQQWTPTTVDEYVGESKVLRKDGTEASAGEYTCPSVGPRACLRRTSTCKSAAEKCALTTPHDAGDHISDGAIYVRTLHRPDPGANTDEAVALRGLFRPVTDVARQTQTLIQYWFFYPYDEWTTKVLGARLTQRHEADWEAVTVGLGPGDSPLFVAYSAHCGGTWRRWDDAKHSGSHPLVAVANGSQANYPDAGDKRPPDWTSCKRLPRGIGTLLSYAANVRDRTSDDWQWGAEKLMPVTEKAPPMNFPGSWGGNDITQFKNARSFTSRPGGGPASPPLQPLWQDPVKTIFCDRYWHGPESCET